MGEPTTVGVLALQGDVREHEAAFEELGVATRRVRRPGDLEGLAGIVLPGGESTTLSKLLESSGLFDELQRAVKEDVAVFGTCAGLILLAARVEDGRADQRSFGVLDVTVRRNGYGPQRFSFEGRVDPVTAALGGAGSPMPAVFIRAPVVVDVGPDVEVLATHGSGAARMPVVVRQSGVLGASFHPELTGDRRLHRLFASMVAPAGGSAWPTRGPAGASR
jgi:5'-phosphate synthase pdxT subunit